MTLSPKFEEALIYATRVHGGQLRKKTRIPYIGHLLGVTAIAMEYGASETEAIGALLHDAVEDCGGALTALRCSSFELQWVRTGESWAAR